MSSRSSAGSGSPRRPSAGELHVVIVDVNGAPIAGVSVTGSYLANPGPAASTCCMPVSLGSETTGADGVAVLKAPPFTFRPVEVTATRAGWPPRTVSLTALGSSDVERDAWGRVVIFLGPARDIAGRVELGADCPAGFLEVSGGPPSVRAPLGADGRFLLRGLSPGTVTLSVSACGRSAGVTLERGGEGPVVLTLPPAAAGKWPPVTPSAAAPPPVAPPPAVLPCLLPSAELVTAGDFDSLALDARCRFVLAGKRTIAARYEAATWTLVRPDGTTTPVGTSVRGTPSILDSIVLLSVPGDELALDVVDFVRGTREMVRPPSHFVPAADDAVVLARSALAESGSQAQSLEIRWKDGNRRRLPGPVSFGWFLLQEGRLLVYGVLHGKGVDQDVHLLDVTTRVDRVVAKNATSIYVTDEGRALALPSADHMTVYDVGSGAREVLPGAAQGWRVFGRDLAIKLEKDGAASLRTARETVPLGVRLRWDARVQRLDEHHLFFGDGDQAVVIDARTATVGALASGLRVSDQRPVVSGDRIALTESSGRVLVTSLSGGPLRAVGRGLPLAFSPDGRWLSIFHELAQELVLASVDGTGTTVTLAGWGGTFAPDAPALFFHMGKGRFDEPRPLFVTDPALGRSVELEPRALSYQVLKGREVLAVVPPGGKREAGIYRHAVRALSP